MAKKELIPSKQEKAHERLKNFRIELADYRQRFDRLKVDREDNVRHSDTLLQTVNQEKLLCLHLADAYLAVADSSKPH